MVCDRISSKELIAIDKNRASFACIVTHRMSEASIRRRVII